MNLLIDGKPAKLIDGVLWIEYKEQQPPAYISDTIIPLKRGDVVKQVRNMFNIDNPNSPTTMIRAHRSETIYAAAYYLGYKISLTKSKDPYVWQILSFSKKGRK